MIGIFWKNLLRKEWHDVLNTTNQFILGHSKTLKVASIMRRITYSSSFTPSKN